MHYRMVTYRTVTYRNDGNQWMTVHFSGFEKLLKSIVTNKWTDGQTDYPACMQCAARYTLSYTHHELIDLIEILPWADPSEKRLILSGQVVRGVTTARFYCLQQQQQLTGCLQTAWCVLYC